MRISIGVQDPTLRRALFDLLRGAGHEPMAARPNVRCALHIASEASSGGAHAPATLVLGPAHASRGEAQPTPDALRAALATGGTVLWPPPLDPGSLLDALGPAPEPATAHAGAPDLSDAPHPWLVVDPAGCRVVDASEDAFRLLNISRDELPYGLAETALPGTLRDGLMRSSQGALALDHLDGGRWVFWWTNKEGHRIACLLVGPGEPGMEATSSHERSLARIGSMTATLAHEIRNPIASVAGALDLLETETDAEERTEILTMARDRLAAMSRLLEQTLKLARPIQGRAEVVDLASVVDSAVATARFDPLFASVELEFEQPAEDVRVYAFPDSLLHALANLLINAAQAQGGAGRVAVTVSGDPGRGLVRIHDAGPGIAPEKRDEIFEPFYTTKTGGAGLGLSEVRRALEAAGGSVGVEDVPQGACFRLELPRAP